MRSDKSVFYANRGVERNKKPLANLIYRVEASGYDYSKSPDRDEYRFIDGKYYILYWGYDSKEFRKNGFKNAMFFHGLIKPSELKNILGEKQWSKFRQGKDEFIIQRRVDGRNTKKGITAK